MGCRRNGSAGTGAAAGSSPGGLFPAGTSPHTARKVYTPSPQQNSKWYIKVCALLTAMSLFLGTQAFCCCLASDLTEPYNITSNPVFALAWQDHSARPLLADCFPLEHD